MKRTFKTMPIVELIPLAFGVDESKYKKYLNSIEWKSKCTKLFQIRGKKCEICGCMNKIQVHHKTYDRIYKEDLSDLEILCWACHERKHGLR